MRVIVEDLDIHRSDVYVTQHRAPVDSVMQSATARLRVYPSGEWDEHSSHMYLSGEVYLTEEETQQVQSLLNAIETRLQDAELDFIAQRGVSVT